MDTKQFLQHFPNYYLQTFDDKGVDKGLTMHGTPLNLEGSALLNLNQKGAGIFFTPNRFTKSRKAEDCEGVNAWFFEIDNVSLDQQWEKVCNAPLMPSLVVKTKKSLHCYYLTENGTIENFRTIQKGLIKYFDSDPACKDICRVLRVPGFNHCKAEPVMVEVIWEEANKYTEEQLLVAYPYTETVKNAPQMPPVATKGGESFWDALTRIPTRLALEKMSGTLICKGESFSFRPRTGGTEYIDVDGKPANAWLDAQGMIGSGCNGGPTFVQWLGFYGRTKGEIATWAKEHFPSYLPQDLPSKEELALMDSKYLSANEIDLTDVLNTPHDLTWSVPILDRVLTPLSRGRYAVLVGETGAGKTVFAFNMAVANANLGHKVLYLSLEMDNASLIARYALRKLGLSKQMWKSGKFDKEQVNELKSVLPPSLVFMQLDGVESVTVELVSEAIRTGGFDMVFIDNFGFIESKGEDANEQVKNLSRQMVKLKNEFKTCIIALHHFRKGQGQSKRGMDAILGSGKIAHDVDFAIQVVRDADLQEDSPAEDKARLFVNIMKDRDFGDTLSVPVYYVDGTFRDNFLTTLA